VIAAVSDSAPVVKSRLVMPTTTAGGLPTRVAPPAALRRLRQQATNAMVRGGRSRCGCALGHGVLSFEKTPGDVEALSAPTRTLCCCRSSAATSPAHCTSRFRVSVSQGWQAPWDVRPRLPGANHRAAPDVVETYSRGCAIKVTNRSGQKTREATIGEGQPPPKGTLIVSSRVQWT
jgi:hypothetical protein